MFSGKFRSGLFGIIGILTAVVTTLSISSTSLAADKDVKAILETTQGTIEIKLFHKRAPITVSNFVELIQKGFYNNLIFHRVIPGFMIQGGDPQGTGMGGPGYSFADEFHKELRHSKEGILAMANSGKNTNGSQFYITLGPTKHLDDRHSVFGEVVKGMDVVKKIGDVPRDSGDRPKEKVVIKKASVVGDFKPVEVKKVIKLTKVEIEKILKSPVEKLLSSIASALELGKMQAANVERFRDTESTVDAFFKVKFEKASEVTFVVQANLKDGAFQKINQFQFVNK